MIQSQLTSGDAIYTQQGVDKLRQMLEVIECFEGTHSLEITDHQDHIRRIFELCLSSPVFDVFNMALQQEDNL